MPRVRKGSPNEVRIEWKFEETEKKRHLPFDFRRERQEQSAKIDVRGLESTLPDILIKEA